MKRVLLVQPSLQPPGGGNGVAAWMIEALKRDYAVSVLTWRPIDLDPINRYYGTALQASEFETLTVHPMLRRVADRLPLPLALLKNCLLLRACKRTRHAYHVLMTANNEADFGARGIHYIHFPRSHQPRPANDLRWYHGCSALAVAYYRLCERLADFSVERMKQNVTLVNSDWTGAKVKACHGIECTTLPPPAAGGFPAVPWADREDGFVCIGRIAPEKEIERVMDIIAAVRAQRPQVHLHIIGTADDPAYCARVRARAREHAAWIHLEEDISREHLARLVAQHRYGIHGMPEEHFGMAVAEMLRAGCIVFVPQGGGQLEIVDGEDQLVYATAAEATRKILQVLESPERQAALRCQLAARKELFSSERFMERLREIVRALEADRFSASRQSKV